MSDYFVPWQNELVLKVRVPVIFTMVVTDLVPGDVIGQDGKLLTIIKPAARIDEFGTHHLPVKELKEPICCMGYWEPEVVKLSEDRKVDGMVGFVVNHLQKQFPKEMLNDVAAKLLQGAHA